MKSENETHISIKSFSKAHMIDNGLIFTKNSIHMLIDDFLHVRYLFLFYLFVGPQKWHEKFPLANGQRQSPVNITTSKTKASSDLQVNPLRWSYVPENVKSLVNPGYCWRVDVNGKGSELTGGPLNDDKFVVEQFHCHWGLVRLIIYFPKNNKFIN
jgi:hypothetical protein